MSAKIKYCVLGSGMQGAAAGYYLAKHGQAAEICFADIHESVAKTAADRVNKLTESSIASFKRVDASDRTQLLDFLKNYDACFSAIHYKLNREITDCCIEAKTHMVDLGGNTDVVRSQLKLHEKAMSAGISVVPDCGLAPGLGNTLASHIIEQLDEVDEVKIRCGGLPQNPKPPLDYMLVFAVSGLTNEYFGKAWVLRNSEIEEIDTFSELENLEFEKPVGKCEAFVTTGGTSTAPWTFKSKVKNYNYKTVRYPGHHEKMKVMMDLGFLDEEPVEVSGQTIQPRDVFHTLAEKNLDFPGEKDLVVLRATGSGMKSGKKMELSYELIDFFDEATEFTAMERGTGFPAAQVLIELAVGRSKPGVIPLETAIQNEAYLKALGSELKIKETITG